MGAWIFSWRVIHDDFHRRGTIAVVVLILPRLDHFSAAVLSTPVEMCSRGAMRGGGGVEVGDVCRQLQVVDRQKSLGVIICENVGTYGGAKC